MYREFGNLVRFILALAFIVGAGLPSLPASAEMSELETFIRSRIEIGESMTEYMHDLGKRGEYNPKSGRPSMEQMKKMEEEINALVMKILGSYGLTIEEYEDRRTEVFSDQAAVDSFLDAHPDLKERFGILPLHRVQPRGGPI